MQIDRNCGGGRVDLNEWNLLKDQFRALVVDDQSVRDEIIEKLFDYDKISIDWSYLNWANMSLSAILVFVATLIGGAAFRAPNLGLSAKAHLACMEQKFSCLPCMEQKFSCLRLDR